MDVCPHFLHRNFVFGFKVLKLEGTAWPFMNDRFGTVIKHWIATFLQLVAYVRRRFQVTVSA